MPIECGAMKVPTNTNQVEHESAKLAKLVFDEKAAFRMLARLLFDWRACRRHWAYSNNLSGKWGNF